MVVERRWGRWGHVALALATIWGCSSEVAPPAAAAGAAGASVGSAGTAGASAQAGGLGGGGLGGQPMGGAGGSAQAGAEPGGTGGVGGTGGLGGTCEPLPAPQVSSGEVQQFDLQLMFEGQPFERGNTLIVGTEQLTLSVFLFFLSQARLVQGDTSIPVDLVNASGQVLPYGVHLFDLENPESYSFRVKAPPGTYQGLQVAVGLSAACNAGNSADRGAPLNASSPMNWTWGTGYIFFRMEGILSSRPLQIHGGALGATGSAEALISIPGELTVNAGVRQLVLDLKPVVQLAAQESHHIEGGRVLLDALPSLTFLQLATP